MNTIKDNRKVGLLILLLIYIIATLIGFGIYQLYPNLETLWRILLADVAATVFVWFSGVILKTASTYDPYWSIQTTVIGVILLATTNSWNLGNILFTSAILIYAVRLTVNFIKTFYSLRYEDWRYKMLREKTGKFYQLVNLLGICMFPTFVVFFASIPYYRYILNGTNFQVNQITGLLVMLASVILEFVADKQMHRFIATRTSKSEMCRDGVWKTSRHPNYLGEIMFWVGIFLVYTFSSPADWLAYIGFIANFLMFKFISIPMAENHYLNYKENYRQYQKETHCLLIFPVGKKAMQEAEDKA